MAHNKAKPMLYRASLVIGVPGVGLQTLAKLMNWFYLDGLGYRGTHSEPQQWLWSLDRMWYKMTDPDKPFNCIGFAQNWQAVIYWPWKHVIALEMDKEIWKQRFIKYRIDHKIEGDHEIAFQHAFEEQEDLVDVFSNMFIAETQYTILSYGNETPNEIVTTIKEIMKGGELHGNSEAKSESTNQETTDSGENREGTQTEKV